MLDRIKALTRLDRKRLDATLMRIHGRASLMVLFNCVLLAINSLGKIKRLAQEVLSRLGLRNASVLTGASHLQSLPVEFKHRKFNQQLSVLIVCETSIDQCFRYRVKQKLEQLDLLGIRNGWVNWTNYMEVSNQIHFFDVIIFYRVPGYPKMMANIDYANRLGKIVVYDTDDLIFDRAALESYYDKTTGQLSARELKAVFKGADLYSRAISKCSFAITSSESLKTSLEKLLGPSKVFILPNGLDQVSDRAVKSNRLVKQPGKINLFYGSGTKTHDQDFAQVAPALERVLALHSHVNLVIVGLLTLPDNLLAFVERITKVELLGIDAYFELLAHADINLAPLSPGFFADCKSEIKWLEAAVFSVPTVASATKVYKQAIQDEVDGLLAASADDWFRQIDRLICDEKFRQSIGKNASLSACSNYSIGRNAQIFHELLQQFKTRHLSENEFTELSADLKQVGIVNVLYPPLAMGGATVVAQNIVDTLAAEYGDRYQVSVFTCDVNNIYAHQLTEYEHNGISVTAVSVPVGPDVDYREYDAEVGKLFARFIEHKQLDLVHFHSIQRLSVSMLIAAYNQKIPFVTTVHDAWWLSDHQFLVDKQGHPVNELQGNPVVAAQTSNHLQQTLERRKTLVNWLSKSEVVLAVSEYQQSFYQNNGIENVVLNKNGVNRARVSPRFVSDEDKVVLGYTGSVCHHKGYYFLKEVIERAQLANIKLKLIQFDLSEPKTDYWNTTEVAYLPKFNAQDMGEFYSQIDILIAPSIWPESFGLITREAALAGVWVIASDAGGLAEEVIQGGNGFKFEMGNADELTRILVDIDNNPGQYRQRVNLDALPALQIQTVTEQVAELDTIYSRILTRNRV